MVGFYLKGLLLSVLAGAAAGVASAIVDGKLHDGWVIIAVLVVFVAVLVRGIVRRRRTTYTITSQRLTVDTGLLNRDIHQTRLERVQNVNSRQSLLDRILRVGTVEFDTAGGSEYDFSFRGVSDPGEIVRTVDRALRELSRTHSSV
jgi:uncharacterized membrane protein YdbT with pleckstrin-like domain